LKAILEDPARFTHQRGGLPKHLLSGIVTCGLCGNRLSIRRRGKNWVYYCSATHPGQGCGKIQRVGGKIEHLVTEALFVACEGETFRAVANEEEEEDSIQQLYEQLARDQGLLDRLEDKVAQELISVPTAKRNRSEIERRMELTRRQIDDRRGNQIMTLVPTKLREVWTNLSLDRQRNIIKAVVEKITVHPQPNAVVFDPDAIEVSWRV